LRLKGPDLERLFDALVDAFDVISLRARMALAVRDDEIVARMVEHWLRAIVFDLVVAAEDGGWTTELHQLRGARPALAAFLGAAAVAAKSDPVKPGQILIGPAFNEPVRIETIRPEGNESWTIGVVGTRSEQFRPVTFTKEQLETLKILSATLSYRGEGQLLRLGVQAYALGVAYEFDPFFGLSISRVDPLPHQLEAVYEHLLKPARVRFLLADDAGAGKTIMSGLLLRELKLRGLVERILIVCPANLAFQWQRELREKFDEKFVILRGPEHSVKVTTWVPMCLGNVKDGGRPGALADRLALRFAGLGVLRLLRSAAVRGKSKAVSRLMQ
jgi:hypothetical protein